MLCVLALLSMPLGADGDLLRARLAAAEPIRIVFLGDSITDGFDLAAPERDSFPVLFRELLAEAWPQATFVPSIQGEPGAPTAEALLNFDLDVEPFGPHLVVIQFGGNDKGAGAGIETLARYEANLHALIDRARAIGAAPIVMAPPMHEPVVGMPYPETAAAVAARRGVPCARIDDALEQPPADYRGTFPYGVHPREHEHQLMALELFRAFGELLGPPSPLRVALPAASVDALPGAALAIPVRLGNTGAAPLAVEYWLDTDLPALDPTPLRRDLVVRPGAEESGEVTVRLPPALPGGRTGEYRLRLCARSAAGVAFALARMTMAPILGLPADGATVPLAELTQSHLTAVVEWSGPEDLSARVYAGADEETVRLVADVTDDRIDLGTGLPYGDGLELYLDLRPAAERGRPAFSRLCATLFVPAAENPTVTTLTADEPPPGLLLLRPVYSARPAGYRLSLDLPRAMLDREAGRRVTDFGLDLAVDDADGNGRDAQLLWVGRTDDFVNARCLAEVRLGAPPAPGTARVTVF